MRTSLDDVVPLVKKDASDLQVALLNVYPKNPLAGLQETSRRPH